MTGGRGGRRRPYSIAGVTSSGSRTGSGHAYPTLLGGGAFGNRSAWILDAMERALDRHRDRDLDVAIVSHGSHRPEVRRLIDRTGD